MDYFTKKEMNGFKSDKKASEIALDSEKEMFKDKLLKGMGNEIIETLNAPNNKNNKIFEEKKQRVCFFKRLLSLF